MTNTGELMIVVFCLSITIANHDMIFYHFPGEYDVNHIKWFFLHIAEASWLSLIWIINVFIDNMHFLKVKHEIYKVFPIITVYGIRF